MFSFVKEIISDAEHRASSNAPLTTILESLRRLSLDDFGRLLLSMPNAEWPALSRCLPEMAEESVQERFTGRSGIDLYKQTAAFVRQLEGQFARHRQRALDGASVLDFGCGYGRIIRMMYYYADPSHIWGVDAEQTPLDICNKDRVKANLAKIENIPSNLPLKEKSIDLAYAYSVFTHLPGHVADACLQAIKKTMRPNALFIATIWPVEVWSVIDTMRKTEFIKTMPGIHERTGLAHVPHDVHKDYGLTTTSPKFFEERGWNVLGYESSIFDPNQISIVLELE